MASWNRRFTVVAVVLPLFLLIISGLARANVFIVDTLDGDSDPFACTLPDAIDSANMESPVAGCFYTSFPASGADVIVIGLTGTISVDAARLPLTISDKVLEITTYGDGPVVIDGSAKAGTEGGTMYVSSLSKFLELTNLTFAHGLAYFGGAIYSGSGGDVDIKDCLFEDNTANFFLGGEGGAIFEDTGRMEITNSTFYANDALKYTGTAGGAIYVEGLSAPCADTAAACSGGPISSVNLKLTNSTFEHNYAKEGSAIYNDAGTVDAKSNIFADHLDHAGTGVTSPLGNCAGTASPPVTDENYNVSVDNSCGFGGSSKSNQTAADVDLDPLGLQNNGGPSFTVALHDNSSVAYGFIPVADCTEQDSHNTPLGVDQRLFGRPDSGDPDFCDSGAFELNALGPYTLNSHRVQIAHSSGTNKDMVNIGITFTSNGDPDCDLGIYGDEDALNYGIDIGLLQGTCASLPFNGLFVDLYPFVVHTVNKEQYGTFYQTIGPETVSARMVAFPPQPGICGEWTLNLEVGGLNTHGSINLPGGNPFALLIFDPTGDGESCFDINNAIVGNQIPTPGHGVRRGVRR